MPNVMVMDVQTMSLPFPDLLLDFLVGVLLENSVGRMRRSN